MVQKNFLRNLFTVFQYLPEDWWGWRGMPPSYFQAVRVSENQIGRSRFPCYSILPCWWGRMMAEIIRLCSDHLKRKAVVLLLHSLNLIQFALLQLFIRKVCPLVSLSYKGNSHECSLKQYSSLVIHHGKPFWRSVFTEPCFSPPL